MGDPWAPSAHHQLSTSFGVSRAWLGLQCLTRESVHAGSVWRRSPDGGGLRQVARWPDDAPLHPALEEAAGGAVEAGQGLVRRIEDDELATVLAYPLQAAGAVEGVVALACSEADPSRLSETMRQVQWGAARLREALGLAGGEALERTRLVLDVAVAVSEADGISPACHAAVSELSHRCGCDRVTVGFVKGDSARVEAISLSAEFGKRMNLVRQLEAAMDEAIEQRAIAVYPPPPMSEPLTLQAHQDFSRGNGSATLVTVPLLAQEEPVGAMVFERAADRPFDQTTIDILSAAVALVGPMLDEKRRNDRSLASKALEVARLRAEQVFGPDHTGAKLLALGICAVLLFAVFSTGRDRVTADARVEGRVQRAIVAPFDGYVREAPVRAGDVVEEGALLAAMDDRDLVIERLKWSTEESNKEHEFERALSDRNLAEANVIRTQIEGARAQIRLIDELLARSRLVAPFDGVVVSGDLSQAIGAAAGRGDTFFQLAPLDEYRVVLSVDETRVADVSEGARGELLLAALPDEPLDFVVEKITPVATVEDGSNVFRVEASLDAGSPRLRPGMDGVAKVDVGRARTLWIWLRPAVDWVRMSFWRWLP